VTTPGSVALFRVAMICWCGLPLLGWCVNIIALRHYALTPERMAEIRERANGRKAGQNGEILQ
ncbi:MAG: hypothetical protein LBD92_07200, partial [Oscillospiraceae bacterium]|nr:hypothetical protein [Oscillospiraceae bacterium]